MTVAAPRGRLVRRVESWTPDAGRAFGETCAVEARQRVERSPELKPHAEHSEQNAATAPVVAAFIAARLAELQDGPAGYEEERARQARWLADFLDLRS